MALKKFTGPPPDEMVDESTLLNDVLHMSKKIWDNQWHYKAGLPYMDYGVDGRRYWASEVVKFMKKFQKTN
ncbi:hypothetical protein [Furfurilactobacillus entadae]|uniref:hypothetical protein n=1 Tax=Furfurilactobacillus entadae TaxID=2922307 RepID=UPI0035E93F7B